MKNSAPEKGKAGRPTLYNQELSDLICEQLMAGRSLVQICNDDGMPDRVTVIRWMGKHEEFATRCAHARDEQADLMDDRILDVADKTERGEIDPHAAKVVISALQWRAMKLRPKKYGDKIDLNHGGQKDNPVLTADQRVEKLGEILASIGKQK